MRNEGIEVGDAMQALLTVEERLHARRVERRERLEREARVARRRSLARKTGLILAAPFTGGMSLLHLVFED